MPTENKFTLNKMNNENTENVIQRKSPDHDQTTQKRPLGAILLITATFLVILVNLLMFYFTAPRLKYEKRGDEYAVIGYFGPIDRVEIPSEYRGHPVTSIDGDVFKNCSTLKRVTMSENIRFIGQSAFEGAFSLETVTLSPSLQTISTNVFFGCTSLTEVIIPEGVSGIGPSAFAECASLKTLVLPQSLETIGSQAFANSGLENIILPCDLQAIGESSFLKCSNLKAIIIPESVTSIGYQAFKDCDQLTINCVVSILPEGWHEEWNPSGCPLNLGYQGE